MFQISKTTLLALALSFGVSAANASAYVIQLDDLSDPTLYGSILKDGILMPNQGFTGTDGYTGNINLFNGAVLSGDDFQYFGNICEPGNCFDNTSLISDTLVVSGKKGQSFFTISFHSDSETPLVSVSSDGQADQIVENGQWQWLSVNDSKLTIKAGNDTYGVEFRSDVVGAVPEFSTWGMMIVGFVGVGLIAYYRKRESTLRLA